MLGLAARSVSTCGVVCFRMLSHRLPLKPLRISDVSLHHVITYVVTLRESISVGYNKLAEIQLDSVTRERRFHVVH